MPDERWTQDRIDRAARSHLLTVAPLVKVLGGSDDDTDEGYVEVVDRRVQLTEQGQALMAAARKIAWESATRLGELLFGEVRGDVDYDFLEEVQSLLALTTRVMDGTKGRVHDQPPGLTPTWVFHTLYERYYRPLLDRRDVSTPDTEEAAA